MKDGSEVYDEMVNEQVDERKEERAGTLGFRILTQRIWQGRQSWKLQASVKMYGEIVRVNIKRDAHDFQSWAKVEKWTDERGWQEFVSIPIAQTPVHGISYVSDEGEVLEPIVATRDLLVAEARKMRR